jgi:hypothetical protein
MMLVAKALAVGQVERCAAIFKFNDVISDHPIPFGISPAMHAVLVTPFAPVARSLKNLIAPAAMLRRLVVRIVASSRRWRFHSPQIYCANFRSQSP